jgi:hypothetical protein
MHVDIYWIEHTPAGKLAVLGRPRALDWLPDEIAAWKAAGITDVVSLLEQHEVLELGLQQEAALAAQEDLTFTRFPIPDRSVPASTALTHNLWDRLAVRLQEGRAVGVHRRASIGRAGLIATGVLMRVGVPEKLAWQHVSKARGRPVPDTDEQRAWLSEVWQSRQQA